MAGAIKKISIERGYDVSQYALNCFGSAGGQHACLIADILDMKAILVHPMLGRVVGLWHGTRRGARQPRTFAGDAS